MKKLGITLVTLGSLTLFGLYLFGAGSLSRDEFANVYVGDSKNYRFTVKNHETYDACDITGDIIKFRVKASASDATYVIDKTCTITDADEGQATVALAVTDTDLDTGTYYAYVVLTNASGSVYETLLKSKWIVIQ